MVTVESSIEIRCPLEVVFAFVADKRNSPQWQGAVKAVRVTPDGPPTLGAQVMEEVSLLGVKLHTRGAITALEPNRAVSIQATGGPTSAEETWRFEATGAGTRLTDVVQAQLGGLLKVAGPLLAGQLKKQITADLQRLKGLLEAPA